jgi:hypothetical protein
MPKGALSARASRCASWTRAIVRGAAKHCRAAHPAIVVGVVDASSARLMVL